MAIALAIDDGKTFSNPAPPDNNDAFLTNSLRVSIIQINAFKVSNSMAQFFASNIKNMRINGKR